MRELLAKQRRFATGSEQRPAEAKPTTQMEPLALAGLRSASRRTETTLPLIPPRLPASVAPSRARNLVILAAVATLSALWLVAAAYLLATW